MLRDINGKELSKVFKMPDSDILRLLYGKDGRGETYFEAKKRRQEKRLLDLDNRKYMFTSDLDVVSMILDAIKKPISRA